MHAAPQRQSKMSASPTVRRNPVQNRSQETVQKVLAAAGVLLARGLGADVLTTAQIAAEAGVSVGALYRFFPDKQAIVDAIALSHMERFQEALTARLMLAFPPDAAGFIGAVVDGFAEYLEAHADFRTIAFAPGGRSISGRTREAYAQSGDLLHAVREVLVESYGIAAGPELAVRLRLATEVGDRLLACAFAERDGARRSDILGEARRILTAVLFGT
jgi:AcrR family transcriptional regulator